ncbi:hypothetical protein MATL_G00228640 [Megalops atlanticus]|uniref:Ig-like domain-containing protein n=1 Tax=Megalops atlanticus TaxID=7932 RepID=A0A9D3T238_MEGAT|nr:hypothetical protein MATL_G00228640 [Megalops atlanticus]
MKKKMIGVLVLLFCGFPAGFAVRDLSRTYLTGTTGLTDLPEFVAVHVVDYETVAYFDSTTRHLQFREKWLQDNMEQKYIDFYNNILNRAIADLIHNLHYVMLLYNQMGGIHTFQLITGCDVSEDGKTGGLAEFGYDGEDFTRLDMSTYTWSGTSHQASIFNGDWNHRADIVQFWKGYLENDCLEFLKKSVDYGKESLERKVPPEVSLLRRDPSSPVTCLATGFFPKEIVVSWQKDGEDLHEDVELLETVPNEDGTFQTRSRLTVSPADLKEHKFTCIVDHISLEEMIIKPVTDRDIKSNQENSLPVGIIIGVALAVLLVAIAAFAGYRIFRMRRGANTLEELWPLRNHNRRGESLALTRSHLSMDQRQGQSGDQDGSPGI